LPEIEPVVDYFIPVFTSNYRIEVRNLGNVWNEFSIVTR
jgi:hypothetical protein